MTNSKQPRLGALLVESMAQAVAIEAGRLRAPRRHRRTIRDSAVTPPHDTARRACVACGNGSACPNRSLRRP